MAQPAYDPAKHHVGLGPDGSEIGLMIAGGYRRGPQRDQGGSTEFGGDQDVGYLPGHSRWTQDDFTGGQYQDVWGDPAMFHHCHGFRPLSYSRALATIQKGAYVTSFSAIPSTWFSGTEISVLAQPALVFAFKGWIHFVYASYERVLSFDAREATFGDWVLTTLTNGFTNVAAFHKESAVLYVGDDSAKKLWRYAFNATSGAWTASGEPSYTYPTAVGNRGLIGMNADGPRITCAFEGLLADLTPPDDPAAAVGAGSKQWAVNKRHKLPALWRSSLFFNSQLYILLNDEYDPEMPNFRGETGWTTQILAWDGSDLYPVVNFPYVFRGRTLIEYGGRVFVAGDSQDLGGQGSGAAEIFEVTGSSLRSVRSWGSDRRSGLTDDHGGPSSITSLLVFEGLLWFYNDSTQRAEAYDIVTDAFFGGPSLVVTPGADDVGALYRLVPLGNTFGLAHQAIQVENVVTPPTPPVGYPLGLTWSWRGQEAEGSPVEFDETHLLETSDFSYEPSRDKKLTEVVVASKVAAPSLCEVSIDGGDSFTTLSAIGTPSEEGNWFISRYDASGINPAKRFRVQVSFASDELSDPIELHSITTLFTVLPSGKKAWSFTVLGPERIEGRDHETVVQDTTAIASSLFSWHQTGATLVFTDLDGTEYNVRVDDVEEDAVEIGPDVEFGSGTRPEAHYAVTLIEL